MVTYQEFFAKFQRHLSPNVMSNFTVELLYEYHIGRFTETVKQVITEEVFNSKYGNLKNEQEIYKYVLNDFKWYLNKNPQLMMNYVVNTDLIDSTIDDKLRKRQKRIYKYFKLNSSFPCSLYMVDEEDFSTHSTALLLNNRLVLYLHPSVFRLMNRERGTVIYIKRKLKEDTTGIKTFNQFIADLYKKDFITKNEYIELKQSMEVALNLRRKV